jgi:hypothetical protein
VGGVFSFAGGFEGDELFGGGGLVRGGFDSFGVGAVGGCDEGLVAEGGTGAAAFSGSPDAEFFVGAVAVDGEEAGRADDPACAEAVVGGDGGAVVGSVLRDQRVAALVNDEEVVALRGRVFPVILLPAGWSRGTSFMAVRVALPFIVPWPISSPLHVPAAIPMPFPLTARMSIAVPLMLAVTARFPLTTAAFLVPSIVNPSFLLPAAIALSAGPCLLRCGPRPV